MVCSIHYMVLWHGNPDAATSKHSRLTPHHVHFYHLHAYIICTLPVLILPSHSISSPARLLPTSSPSSLLCLHHSYEELLAGTAKKQVYVLPAFETAPQKNITRAHELADNASMMVKPELAKLVKRRLMYQFALYLFRQVGGAAGTTACVVAVLGACRCTWWCSIALHAKQCAAMIHPETDSLIS